MTAYTDADVELIEAAWDEHQIAIFDGLIAECRCGSRDDHHAEKVALAALAAAGRLLPADRVADAVLVRQAAEADIARQVLILAEDPKILAMWADACQPRPVTVADHFRALAGKLRRPTPAEEPA